MLDVNAGFASTRWKTLSADVRGQAQPQHENVEVSCDVSSFAALAPTIMSAVSKYAPAKKGNYDEGDLFRSKKWFSVAK